MIVEFLQANGIQLDDGYYELPPRLMRQIADEFDLDFERGSSIVLSTYAGTEIELSEATVH